MIKKNLRLFGAILVIVIIAVFVYAAGVKRGSPIYKVIPSALPELNSKEPVKWRTYTSQDGSVSNSYPEDWTLTYGGEQGWPGTFKGGTTVEWWMMEKTGIQINANLEKNNSGASLDKYLDCSISVCSKVTYNGQEYLTNSHDQGGFSKNLITVRNGYLLFISYSISKEQIGTENAKDIDKILSTFKFTE